MILSLSPPGFEIHWPSAWGLDGRLATKAGRSMRAARACYLFLRRILARPPPLAVIFLTHLPNFPQQVPVFDPPTEPAYDSRLLGSVTRVRPQVSHTSILSLPLPYSCIAPISHESSDSIPSLRSSASALQRLRSIDAQEPAGPDAPAVARYHPIIQASA